MRFNVFNLYIEPPLDELFKKLKETGSKDELLKFSANLVKLGYKEVLPLSLIFRPDDFAQMYVFRYYKGNKVFHYIKEAAKIPNDSKTSDLHSFFCQEYL